MKSFAKYILAAFLCASIATAAYGADYDGHWAREYIMRAAEEGVITDAENFRPDDFVTRAEFAAMIVRDRKLLYGLYPTSFYDVDEDSWYFKYVSAAENKGIVTGDGSFNFYPDAALTRQDAAVILGRAYGAAAEVGFNLSEYRDGIYISQYALGYMTYMTKYGIINGFEDGSVRPLDKITRAQAAAMLYRIRNPIKEKPEPENVKISFKKGYPALNDTGAMGGFNLSLRTDSDCDIYYSITNVGEKAAANDITTPLCRLSAGKNKDTFIAYSGGAVDIHIIARDGNGGESSVKTIRNAAPLCFERGNGTYANPYMISTQAQLEAIARYPKKHFALANDIELDADFAPIGSAYVRDEMFSGSLNGRGHMISSLDIDTNEKFVGLFSCINGAVIKNLYVNAKTVSGENDVGIITGENIGGTIENCFVTGVVRANNNNAGGIAGTNNGKIINCASAAVIVESSMYAGGIAGVNFGTVQSCASYAHTVTAQMYAGGICASNSGGNVKNCLAANMNIETVISANSGRITMNLAGGVTDNNYCYNKTNAFVTNGYNDASGHNGTDVSWNELMDSGFYKKNLGWNTDSVWKRGGDKDIFLLPTPSALGTKYKIGGLTEFTPVKITDEDGFLQLYESPELHYMLDADISLTKPWRTVCAEYGEDKEGFSGSFNGGGHVIENLTQTYNENISLYGFIGFLDGGTIRNVRIKNAVIEGGRYTGGVCAVNFGIIDGAEIDGSITVHDTASAVVAGGICALNYSEIENAVVRADLSAYANSVTAGGVCGHNEGRIYKTQSSGSLATNGMKAVSNSALGGVAGYSASGDIYNSFSDMKITAEADTVYAGGVCGMLDTGEIYKCSADADIDIVSAGGSDSKAFAGGAAGLSNAGSIVHSFSTGRVSSAHGLSYVGGITGYNAAALIQNTYSTAQLSQMGANSAAGGIAGFNESGSIMYNAALNVSVRSDGAAARVCGSNAGGMVETNFAALEMLINHQTADDNALNGVGRPAASMNFDFFFRPVYDGGELGWSSARYDGENGVWTGMLVNGGYYRLPLLNDTPNQHMFTMPIYEARTKK